jgi:hypothetical protein
MDRPPIIKPPAVPRLGSAKKPWRTIVVAGLVLFFVLVAVLIWLSFDVFHIFNIANVVSGGN